MENSLKLDDSDFKVAKHGSGLSVYGVQALAGRDTIWKFQRSHSAAGRPIGDEDLAYVFALKDKADPDSKI